MNQISTQGYPAVEIAYRAASKTYCPFTKREKAPRISDCSYGAFHVAGKNATPCETSYEVDDPQSETVVEASASTVVTEADADFIPVFKVGGADSYCFRQQNQICVFNV